MDEQQRRYLELVLEQNKTLNLTAVTDPADAAARHTEDSLALLNVVDCAGKRVIDVGAGGGFPGMALAIACPAAGVTLLDATAKKVAFLAKAAQTLSLSNVKTLHGRAELLTAAPPHREAYDVCVSRGVARLAVLAELCLPFVAVGGTFLAMKQGAGELPEARTIIAALGGSVRETVTYTLSNGVEHVIIIVDKVAPTPKKSPRRFAKIDGSV